MSDELISRARGALRVLRNARDSDVIGCITSSFAAVAYTMRSHHPFTETDWINLDDRACPLRESKAIAERAAEDFIARERGAGVWPCHPVGVSAVLVAGLST